MSAMDYNRANNSSHDSIDDDTAYDDNPGGRKATKRNSMGKRRKVNHACIFCRRSHMTCDDGRPCQRCIKREIGHLCHDERKGSQNTLNSPRNGDAQASGSGMNGDSGNAVVPSVNQDGAGPAGQYQQQFGLSLPQQQQPANANPRWNTYPQFQSETLANELSFLTDFLENLDDQSFFGQNNADLLGAPLVPVTSHEQQQGPVYQTATGMSTQTSTYVQNGQSNIPINTNMPFQGQSATAGSMQPPNSTTSVSLLNNITASRKSEKSHAVPQVLPSATKREKFLLMAADQEPGSRNERLQRVINAKYEAGLLKPYNYVKGYARLSKWMDRNVSQDSKMHILQPLSILRPRFRAVAQPLTDAHLVVIEEEFERLLLDYDRVFAAMGIPACLWRRTGEIFKGNREFAELVGVNEYMLRDGRLCIYELMAEESAVNYWEKYGNVAFDSNQKAVLTSCVLRYKPQITLTTSTHGTPVSHRSRNTSNAGSTKKEDDGGSSGLMAEGSGSGSTSFSLKNNSPKEQGFVNCCFSFTIRRDMVGIPSMIVGNFIKC